jgi:F-box protein 11
MADPKPAAFLGYAHVNDDHDDGRLTQLRERLSREVEVQTGASFPIFQDRSHIKWGQNWRRRVDDSLNEVTFLIPVVTPSFLASAECKREVEVFALREKELKRDDLILPIYYVTCDEFEASGRKSNVARILLAHQYADWRDYRFEPLTGSSMSRRIAELASQVRDALDRKQQSKASSKAKPAQKARPQATPTVADEERSSRRATSRSEVPVIVVDPLHRGEQVDLRAAISEAAPGSQILVRAGVYQGPVVIDKPLEILGEGEAGAVVIQCKAASAVQFHTGMGRLSNLSIRQLASDKVRSAVTISQGRVEIDGCDITSRSGTCITISAGAAPAIRRCSIHSSPKSGIFVTTDAEPTIEDCDIYGNSFSGVSIKNGGNPVLRRNRIHDNAQNGVFGDERAFGLVEDNDLYDNKGAGLSLRGKAELDVRRNRIYQNERGGVNVVNEARGMFFDNDIDRNIADGASIGTGGDPTLKGNRIRDNTETGIFCFDNGRGTVTENDITGNKITGVCMTGGGAPTVRRNRINRNRLEAIWSYDGGRGLVEDNDLRENGGKGAYDLSEDSDVVRRRNLVDATGKSQ